MRLKRYVAIFIGFLTIFLLIPYLTHGGVDWGHPRGGLAIFGLLFFNLNMIAVVLMASFVFALEITAIYILIVRRKEILEALKRAGFKGGRRSWVLEILALLIIAAILFALSSAHGPGEAQRTIGAGQFNATTLITAQPQSSPLQYGYLNFTEPSIPVAHQLMRLYGILALVLVIVFSIILIRLVTPSPGFEEVEERRELARVIEETVRRLRVEGDARKVIVDCYLEMCRLLSEFARRPQPFETPREFKKVILEKYPELPEGPLESLTTLFEEAVYSRHELGEPQVKTAIKSLEDLQAALYELY